MNRRTFTSILLLTGTISLAVVPGAQALDPAEARRIALTYIWLHPGDDIENDFRILHVQAADLDRLIADQECLLETAAIADLDRGRLFRGKRGA